MKKLTQAEAVHRIQLKYPMYDLSQFIYINSTTKSTVVCPLHGVFENNYDKLMSGHGCQTCGVESRANKRRLSQQEAMARMKEAAPELDLSLFDYKGATTKSTAVCRKHGAFQTTYQSVIVGHKCPSCKVDATVAAHTYTEVEAIEKLKAKFPELDYSQFSYSGCTVPSTVICKAHGEFQTSFANLIGKRGKLGCTKCSVSDRGIKRRLDHDSVIAELTSALPHFDFSKFEYKTSTAKGIVICKKHGEFKINYNSLKAGIDCPSCTSERRKLEGTTPVDVFKRRLEAVHGSRYSFIESSYNGISNHLLANCSIHGNFHIRGSSLLSGVGCPDCKDSVFNPKKPAYLYMYRLTYQGSELLGFGITSSITRRDEEHRRRLSKVGETCTLLHTFKFKRGFYCREVEKEIKATFKSVPTTLRGFMSETTECTEYLRLLALMEERHTQYRLADNLYSH